MNCKICGSITDVFGSGEILNKYSVMYYHCSGCGFIQTEEPYWLEEAYSKPINNSDTGIIMRNIYHARLISSVIMFCFNSDAKFVDYGGGYGILVRMMRDRGFDFYLDDKYCTNLFANGFDIADAGAKKFELLTALEVFEHFVSPVTDLAILLKKSDSILFTTEIMPDQKPMIGKWWYYGLSHGQHVSFYTRKSLKCLAAKFDMKYLSRNNVHLFMKKKYKVNKLQYLLAINPYLSLIINPFTRKRSLIKTDCSKFIGEEIY